MKKFFKIFIVLVLLAIVTSIVIIIGINMNYIPTKFGTYEDDVHWKYYKNKSLKIEGEGDICFINKNGRAYFPEDINDITIGDGITGIGRIIQM